MAEDEFDTYHNSDKAGYPHRTPVVLATMHPAHTGMHEYRIGMVSAADLREGLHCKEGRIKKVHLNPDVARRCFESSPVFFDEQEAVEAARNTLLKQATTGIKIRHFNQTWPGTSCKVLAFSATK